MRMVSLGTRTYVRVCGEALMILAASASSTCVPVTSPGDGDGEDEPRYGNSSDPTNKSAAYVGAEVCRTCHPGIADEHSIHGHAHKLTRIQGGPPEFPEGGTRAGVPNPPEGFDWSDISYVIGGYTRKARFIDTDGFILTTGVNGVATQWNLFFPANGTTTGFVAYDSGAEAPKPYDFSCFQCHTTGSEPLDEDFPEFQENRPGFLGTWEEAGVQCEACHGPGSNHFSTLGSDVRIDTSAIFVNVAANQCGKCHTRGGDPNIIIASGGYINHHEQWPELRASGGHAGFDCVTCHASHASVNYDRDNAIHTECRECHPDQTMAIHEGLTFVRGDYMEPLSCESCHMPFATRSAASAGEEIVGTVGKMGDTRTHIFRIDTAATDSSSMFTSDGTAVVKDAAGRAAASLDFVCFRCHNDVGNAAAFSSPQFAADVASGMHQIVRP